MRSRLGARYIVEPVTGGWDEVVTATVRGLRMLYAEHPLIVPLLVDKTITSAVVIDNYDRLATALVEAGFPEDEVLTIVAVIDAFTIGFGYDVASPDEIWRPETPTVTLGRLVADGQRGRERADRAFEIGLEMLLDSLRLRLARTLGD